MKFKLLIQTFAVSLLVLAISACDNASESPQNQGKKSNSYLSQDEESELIRMLRGGEFQALSSRIDGYMREFEADILYEFKPIDAFEEFGEHDDILEALDRWVEKMPDSYVACTARARYFYMAGWKARGKDWSSNTPEDNFRKMDAFFEKARADIYEALLHKKNLSIGYRMLISMAAASGTRYEKTAAYAEGIKHVPYSYWIRLEYLDMLQPKWGGSWEEMRQFTDRAAEDAVHNHYLSELKYFPPYYEGKVLESRGDTEKAIMRYDEAMQYFRGTDVLRARASAYKKLGENRKALDDLDDALRINPRDIKTLEHRAYVYIAMNDNASALKDVERAVALDPKSSRTLGMHANLLWNMHKFTEAHRVYERMVELYPKNAWAWSSKGKLNLYELKNYKQAAEDLLKAIALSTEADTWYDYASALYFLEDDRTVAAYQNYLDLCEQGKPCKGKDRNWAKQFLQCINKPPECKWPKHIYQHWVLSESG